MFFTFFSVALSGVAELHRWMVDVYNDTGGGGGDMGSPPSLKDATLFMHILDNDNHDNDDDQHASDTMTVSYLSMVRNAFPRWYHWYID